ncbi:MAG: sulfite exporter TauE/SafE family protein, partial [Acidobacteria bacterium]|nr:sulfite exporter TauE/SafE family protein [Acidobacteriota bacterium]
MTAFELVAVAGAVFVAALVQVLSGFGFALLSVPLMTLAVDTREAVVISTLLGMGVTTWQAWHLREHAVKPLANRLIAA